MTAPIIHTYVLRAYDCAVAALHIVVELPFFSVASVVVALSVNIDVIESMTHEKLYFVSIDSYDDPFP